ncbi:hypothetical protein SRB17_78910 [Streptomyces sp. RB17]|nr:hypothetical protein [Streptomyces sp. RB17]
MEGKADVVDGAQGAGPFPGAGQPELLDQVAHFDQGHRLPRAALRRLLDYGPDVEVLEPPDIRDDLAEQGARTAARYRSARCQAVEEESQ